MTSVLFPIFASYKAIRTSDPAQLTPWLMYWTTLSLFLAGETLLHPILSWVPIYAWIRLGVHLYLVLPGKQGSVYLYQSYIHPFLEEHEREIDQFISEGHDKARSAGLQYLKQGIEWIKVNMLGLPPKQPTPPPSRNASYSQTLLSRFNMPSARQGLATAGATDLFTLLGSAMQQATYPGSKSRDAQVEDLAASGTLVPPSMFGEERINYILTQRNRLQTLLQAFDVEAGESHAGDAMQQSSHLERPSENLAKSRSEAEFEDLGFEELPQEAPKSKAQGGQAAWSKWIWGNYGEKDSAVAAKKQQ